MGKQHKFDAQQTFHAKKMSGGGGFSGAVKLSASSLNDYIAPSQACIVPLSDDDSARRLPDDSIDSSGEILRRSRTAFQKDDDDETTTTKTTTTKMRFEPAKETFGFDGKSSSIQVSLSDCLACSGCVTSAETVLMQQQSVSELLNKNFADKTQKLIVTISPQSVASLAVKYALKSEEMLEKLCGF